MADIVVRIATIRDPSLGFSMGDVPPEEQDRPYDQLPFVLLGALPDETLLEIALRGESRLGFPELQEPAYIEFYDADAQNGRTPYTSAVVLVDREGRAVWGNRWGDIRLDDALTAYHAGAFSGDPRRPIIIPYVGFGNGIILDWPQVLLGLGLLWDAVGHVTTVYGAKELGQRLIKVFRRRSEVQTTHFASWQERSGFPADFAEFVKNRRYWDAAQLASLLGCPTDHARAILTGYGFEWRAERGRWLRVDRPGSEAYLVRCLDELLFWVDIAEDEGSQALREQVQEMVVEFMRTGSAPRPYDLYLRWEGEGGGSSSPPQP